MQKHIVLFSIWHTADQKYYVPGDLVSVDHLSEGQVTTLVDRKVLLPEDKFDLPALELERPVQNDLVAAGITSLEALATAKAPKLAKDIKVSEGQVYTWQAAAKKLLKARQAEPAPKGGSK